MDLSRNKTSLDSSFVYQRRYKRQRSMIDVNMVEDAELLEILEDLSDLELELEQEIEIVQQRQEEARHQLEIKEKIKAENIQIAIEKIKEASIKKMYVKVFTGDGCAKSLLVDETMTAGHVTRILAEKNLVSLSPLWALVELAPDLHIERVYEDHELVVENCLLWRPESRNTLWFMERPEKFDIFQRPQEYFKNEAVDDIQSSSKQELFDKYFSGIGASESAPLEVSGSVWVKTGAKKSWSKQFCVLKSSGLYSSNKKSGDLVCVATFDVNQVYYGVDWRAEHKAPSQFCFAVKHPQIQVRSCKSTKYFCVEAEMELHRWVTAIRILKHGAQLCDNYRDILEDMCCHGEESEDSNQLGVTEYRGNQYTFLEAEEEKLLTPTSENNSFDSGLSSRAASDISEIKTRMMMAPPASLMSPHSGYTSDFEEEELPPLPAQSVTSLHCPESLPPPPGTAQNTLLLIPAPRSTREPANKEQHRAFRTFFEDVWFEESSYNT